MLPLANAPTSDKKDLLSELELMKKLKPHPHVIKLLGCVTETGKRCVKGVSWNLWHISFPGGDCTADDSNDRSYWCTLIGIKGNLDITKVFNYSHRTRLVHQRGRRSIVLEHQYGLCDVCYMEQFNKQKILEWIYHWVEQRENSTFHLNSLLVN